ncbi:alpha-L-fucosidase-like [Haliotis rubra]|uniref:alpha-L-fucosidase-like n=1 Tax=Haliotis rubra TaxID=36100 RepID=UPI001EE6127F|nr:alpha-L-fucosidase-like [Haliotis rubra]
MARWILLSLVLVAGCAGVKYQNNWKSLDARPLPSWYDESKVGIFLHWGVFSVPSYSSEWFWEQWKMAKQYNVVLFMMENYRPDFTYADFAPQFKAEFYSPERWADIFKASGAKYLVLVTKHHEGFTNWPSNYSFNWNAKDVGPNRDLVGDLAAAVRKSTDLHFGIYHSLLEWFHPLYLQDKKNNWTTNNFVMSKAMPELYELVKAYKPEVVWSDGDWEAPDWYWNSTDFLAWLYNESPVKDSVVVNDRWGSNTRCKHGGFWNCNDKYNPGKKVTHKWENCMSIDKGSWGFRRDADIAQLYSMEELISLLVETVSCGGNLLVNVGPTSYGVIAPIYEERLRQMGQWLDVNGEGIYGTTTWQYQNDTINSDVWYTAKKGAAGLDAYAILLKWPMSSQLVLGAPIPSADTNITLLGYKGEFEYTKNPQGGITITLPNIPFNRIPCQWGWTFKIVGLAN